MTPSSPLARRPSIPVAQARRIALAAQGFGRPKDASASPGTRALGRVMDRLQVVQIDSVNVLTRTHYLPFFARLGPYDTALLDRMRDGRSPRARGGRAVVEYWAHEASLIGPSVWPYLGFRMQQEGSGDSEHRLEQEHPGLLAAVLDVVGDDGPLTAREVEAHLPHGAGKGSEHWGWNWSAVKHCLEHLFRAGRLTSAGRTAQFERRYAVPEHVLPPDVLARAPGSPDAPDTLESVTELLRRAVRAHGIGTRRDLADYFRVRGPVVGQALERLVAAGEVEQVSVPGWRDDDPVYLDPQARRPRAVPGAALLSPFDSLVWQRDRVEALWGFRYRIEIYVPAPRRVHGYYVLPFLLDEQLVGRVDLKADRAAGVLRVQALHWEPGTDVARAAPALLAELESMAGWLGLGRVDLPAG